MRETDVLRNIIDRLHSIEAGFADCGIAVVGGNRAAGDYIINPLLQQIHKNRVITLFINVAHLKDDVNRWAKASGIATREEIEGFCKNSQAINLVIGVTNTAKHGLGGRSSNNSILKYGISIVERTGNKPNPSDKIVDLFWLVVDSECEPHQSNLLLSQAINDWLLFLYKKGIDVKKWIEKWKPKPLPKGWSHYKGGIPEGLMSQIREDVRAHGLSF